MWALSGLIFPFWRVDRLVWVNPSASKQRETRFFVRLKVEGGECVKHLVLGPIVAFTSSSRTVNSTPNKPACHFCNDDVVDELRHQMRPAPPREY